MKQSLIALFCLFSILCLSAQNGKYELQILQDSTFVSLLKSYDQEGLQDSAKQELKLEVLNHLSSKILPRLNYEQKMQSLDQLIGILPELKCNFDFLKCQSSRFKGDYATAEELIQTVIECAKEPGQNHLLARTYREYGVICDLTFRAAEGLEYLNQAEEIYKNIKNEGGQIACLISKGVISEGLKDFDRSIRYYNQGIDIISKSNPAKHLKQLVVLNNNLGNVYKQKNDTSKSLEYFQNAYTVYKENEMELDGTYIYILDNIAHTNFNIGNKDKAIEFKNKSIELAKELGFDKKAISLQIALAYYYGQDNKVDKAETIAMKLVKEVEQLNDLGLKRQFYSTLDRIYVEQKDFKKAREYFIKYVEINDTIRMNQNEVKVKELQAVNEAKESKVKLQEREIEIQKKNMQYNRTFGGMLIVSLMSLFFWYRNRSNNRINNQRIQILESNQKLLATNYIIQGQEEERKRIAQDLHDGLGGLLSTAQVYVRNIQEEIDKLSELNLIDKAEELIDNACDEVRRIAHDMMPSALLNLGLKSAIEDLADQVNLSEELFFKTEIYIDEENLDANISTVLFRIIQEIMNNVLKHAEATSLELELTESDDGIMLYATDNGVGMDVENLKNVGLGLNGMKSRVEFLNGDFRLNSKPGEGVQIDIFIPTNSEL